MTGLVPFGVLVSTVYALRGATVVGDAVLEAPVDPITVVNATDGARPVIAVYVGNESHKTDGKLLLEGHRRLEIALQIFLPEATKFVIDGRTVALDSRGLGAELVFAGLMRQIQRALQDGTTPWSAQWNSFVTLVHEVITEPFLFELPGQTRGFAREVTIIVDTADEPEYGVAPYPFWGTFIAALRGLDDYGADVADLLAAEISAPPGLPGWRVLQASGGVSPASARVLGFGPYDPAETDAPPPLQSITVDVQDMDGNTSETLTQP